MKRLARAAIALMLAWGEIWYRFNIGRGGPRGPLP